MASVAAKFASAVSQHRAGRLARAEATYREILVRDPSHAEALHLLALITSEAGQHETAVLLLTRAIEIKGPIPLFCSNFSLVLRRLGSALLERGQSRDAEQAIRLSVKLDPGSPGAHYDLGNAQRALQLSDGAQQSYRTAVDLDPDFAEANFELGNILHASGRHEPAVVCYAEAIRAKPAYAEAYHNLGVSLTILRRFDQALLAYRQAVHFRPDYPEAQNNLGILLKVFQNEEAAADHYHKALECPAGSLEARYNLALLLQEQDRLEEALEAYSILLREHPEHLEARNNLGNVQLALGHSTQGLESYRRALAIDPQYGEAHWNLGLACLRTGIFEEGWREYEWRFKQDGTKQYGQAPREFNAPVWDGSSLKGLRILLHAEQGLGDTIQFVRYAAVAKERGAKVILECQAPLIGLLGGAAGVEQLVTTGDALPEFDCHAALLSMPWLSETTLDSVPCVVPYIHVEPSIVNRWRASVQPHTRANTVFKVGLTWSGNADHKENGKRSVPAGILAELAGVPGVAFYSLQKGMSAVTHAGELAPLELIRLEDESTSLVDTAAILLNLDLLISVDTSLAHLGGALARPVWTLLPYCADWRWLEHRDDSPWYPSMRLFRQSRRGDWTGVIQQVRKALELHSRS